MISRKEAAAIALRWIEDESRYVLSIASQGMCANFTCGGCRQCGGVVDWAFPRFSISALRRELDLLRKAAELHKIKAVKVGTLGSFCEIPNNGRGMIYKSLLEIGVEEVQVEFRPELVTREILWEMKDNLPGVTVVFEVGFDHLNDWARNRVLHRNHGRRVYKQAIRLINDESFVSCTFVAIGLPCGWSESEAIDQAKKTANYVMRAGSKRIWFEPVVLQFGTLQDQLRNLAEWQEIWLWTVRQVVLLTDPYARRFGVKLLIGGTVHEPAPRGLPTNRCRCDVDFWAAIREYNRTGNVGSLRRLADCACHPFWISAFKTPLVRKRQVAARLRRFDQWRAEAIRAHQSDK